MWFLKLNHNSNEINHKDVFSQSLLKFFTQNEVEKASEDETSEECDSHVHVHNVVRRLGYYDDSGRNDDDYSVFVTSWQPCRQGGSLSAHH